MSILVPGLPTDEAAEAFLDHDLSSLDFSQFKPVQFQISAQERPPEHADATGIAGGAEGVREDEGVAVPAAVSAGSG